MITEFKIYEATSEYFDPADLTKKYDDQKFTYIDPDLLIHKYVDPNDPKKDGQIYVKMRNNGHGNYSNFALPSGIARILDTKYENNTKLRAITIPEEFPFTNNQSKRAIIKYFLKQYDYTRAKLVSRNTILNIVYGSGTFYWMIKKCKNLGELIDKMREFQTEFRKDEDKVFYNWKMEQEAEKFNL